MKRLQTLDLAGNNFIGNLSDWLEGMESLRVLDLSGNSLSGVVPDNIGNLSSLTYLDISFNTFNGTLSELHFANLSRLETLDLASNSMKIAFKQSWVPPFHLTKLGLHACLVGPQFPTWLQSQTRIKMIDLGSAGIRGELPGWIWNFSSSITSLDMSANSITGKLPASLEQLKMLAALNLKRNRFEGTIPDLPTSIQLLDISENHLSGSLPQYFGDKELHYLLLSHNLLSGAIPEDLCNMVSMEVIDLSNNNLSEKLPNCWLTNSNLYVIDFSSNNLWGEIPSTMGSINSLISLHLGKNNLSGMLPTSLQSCSRLMLLDLGENNVSGNIPKWIGDSLQTLVVLSLSSNQLFGEIPEELSQLHALQFLDLANNKLSGPVPSFMGNLTALHRGSPYWETPSSLEFMVHGVGSAYVSVYIDTLQTMIKGRKYTFNSEVRYLFNVIDLSANQLTGEIPSEVGFLSALKVLNLSRNHIRGSIPDKLGSVVDLEALDLSWNNLSGLIPHSLTSLTELGLLDLSYNHLLGMIICQTLDGDIFFDSANLSGSPLSAMCVPESNKHQLRFDTLTYLFTLLGFAFGFSAVSTTIICSMAARKAYFQFTDRLLNKLCTVVETKFSINRMSAGRDPSLAIWSQDSMTCYELERPSTATI